MRLLIIETNEATIWNIQAEGGFYKGRLTELGNDRWRVERFMVGSIECGYEHVARNIRDLFKEFKMIMIMKLDGSCRPLKPNIAEFYSIDELREVGTTVRFGPATHYH
jgi:hypothetical protein